MKLKKANVAISRGVNKIVPKIVPKIQTFKTKMQDKATKGIVKFVGNTKAGSLLKAGLKKQGKNY